MMQSGNGGGPQWANPNGTPQPPTVSHGASQQEQEFFAPLSTLDEPVRETIMRDVRSVASKLKVVMLPMDRTVREVMNADNDLVLFNAWVCWKSLSHCFNYDFSLFLTCFSFPTVDMRELLNRKMSN
jgi:hypothetical protein